MSSTNRSGHSFVLVFINGGGMMTHHIFRNLQITLLATVLFTTNLHAAPPKTEGEFKQALQSAFAASSSAESLITNLNISDIKKKETISWLKKNKITALPSFDIRGSDLLLGSENINAKLTLTDYKRGIFHLNDKNFALPTENSTAQNLDYIVSLIETKKSIRWSPLPEAHAFVPLVVGAGVVASALYGVYLMAKPLNTDDIVSNMAELLKKNNINAVSLQCAQDFNGDGIYADFRIEHEGRNYTYISNRISMDKFSSNKVQIKPADAPQAITPGSDELKLLEQAHLCCRRPDCEATAYKQIKKWQPELPQTKSPKASGNKTKR